jgi:O-antigen biosynthesis protein
MKDYQYYYDLGRALAKEQKWQKAIAAYQNALELKDDLAELYHHYGDAFINLQRWQKAVQAYEQAISLDDSFAWSYHNLGVALFNWGKSQEAITAHEKAIAINGHNSQFQYSLGKVLASLGQWQAAADIYKLAIDFGLEKPQAYHEWGDICSELQQWNEAIEAYQLAIKANSEFTWSYHNLGVALLQLQLAQEAVTFFQQAITIDPNFISAYFYLGEAYRLQQQWDEAVTAYRQAAKLKPDFPNLQITLADTLRQRAQWDLNAALETYQQLLATTENQGEIYQKIAVILAEKQQLDQALFYSNFALELEPENESYQAFYTKISQQKSNLYQPVEEYEIADHSYRLWCQYNAPTVTDLRQSCLRLPEIVIRPTINIILPLQESATDWIEETIASIQQQVYPHWQLYLATATVNTKEEEYWQEESKLTAILEVYRQSDRRINYLSCDKQMEIAELVNTVLAKVTGEWIAILQAKTLLTPNALLEFAQHIETDRTADLVYGDNDRLKKGKLLSEPWFKPKWCPDLLLSRNYFGCLVFCRHSLVKEIGGCHKGYEDSYDYDLFLRLTEKTQQISHIPRILSHSQIKHSQIASDLIVSNIQVIKDTLQRRGETGVVTNNLEFPEITTIRYEIERLDFISIIIPTRNLGKMLDECLNSIFNLTTYSNYEAIVVDNGSNDPETLDIIQQWQDKEPTKFNSLKLDVSFNYSLLNNQAVAASQGKYLLFLNNDTRIITPDWLEAMVRQAQRSQIGAVGALLLYPDETIQHAGVILGVTGVAGHGHRNYPLRDTGYNHSLITTTNYSAVTSACLMCRREVFTEVGGFNEQLAVAYNDVDFCLKLQQKGYYNVWLPHVQLYHYESQSRTLENTPANQQRILQEVAYMEDTWGAIIKEDPCYNINLTREKEDYSLNLNYQAEIAAIFLSEVSQDYLWGFFIDEPKPGCVKGNSLDIIGWVVGKISQAISLEILCYGEVVTTTEIDRNRLDVAMAYPQIPEAENSGFFTTINLTTLPHKAELNLQVMLANNQRIKLGKIQF